LGSKSETTTTSIINIDDKVEIQIPSTSTSTTAKQETTTTIDSIEKQIEVIGIEDVKTPSYVVNKKPKKAMSKKKVSNGKTKKSKPKLVSISKNKSEVIKTKKVDKKDYEKEFKTLQTAYGNLKDDYEQLEKQKQVVSSVDTVEIENVKAKKIKKKAKKQSYWKTLKKKNDKMMEDDNNIDVVDIEQDSDYRIIDNKDYKENEEKE